MRTPRRADARAEKPEFAGLPKLIIAFNSANVNTAGAGAWTPVVIDSVYKNYGGYTLTGGGVRVPEVGVYTITMQSQWIGGAAWFAMAAFVNSVISLSPNLPATLVTNTAGVTNPILNASGPVELAANDLVSLYINGPGVNTVTGGLQTWMSLKKEGGQY